MNPKQYAKQTKNIKLKTKNHYTVSFCPLLCILDVLVKWTRVQCTHIIVYSVYDYLQHLVDDLCSQSELISFRKRVRFRFELFFGRFISVFIILEDELALIFPVHSLHDRQSVSRAEKFDWKSGDMKENKSKSKYVSLSDACRTPVIIIMMCCKQRSLVTTRDRLCCKQR